MTGSERHPAIAIFSATKITGSQPAPSTGDRPNFAAEYRDKVAAKNDRGAGRRSAAAGPRVEAEMNRVLSHEAA
jgi:hypothetical protein